MNQATRLSTGTSTRLSTALAVVGVVLCLAASLWTGLRHLEDTLPYPEHIDERTLMRGAKRVLQRGDFDPRIYNYPSLAFYLNAAGLAVGLIHASGLGPDHVTVKDIGRLEPPFYERLAVAAVSRKLWILLGLGCVVGAAAIAHSMCGPVAMLLTALVLTLTATPTSAASSYIGVDVPMSLFVMLILAHLVAAVDSVRYRDRVWIPAALCGAAIACKYTAFMLMVPCVIAIWSYPARDRLSRTVELVVLTFLTFAILCPRFLLDLPNFVDALAFENFHYRVVGHRRFNVEPGFPQLFEYGANLVDTYGLLLISLAVVGAASALGRHPRRAALLLSFPTCWLLLLASYKVHFVRNLLPVVLLVPVLSSIGALASWRAFAGWLRPRMPRAPGYAADLASAAALTAALMLTLPYAHIAAAYRGDTDSRLRFAAWARAHMKAGSELLIPQALPFSPETLPHGLSVQSVDLASAEQTASVVRAGRYMLLPHWTSDEGVAERVAHLAPGLAVLPHHRVVREFPGLPAEPGIEQELSINPAFQLVRF